MKTFRAWSAVLGLTLLVGCAGSPEPAASPTPSATAATPTSPSPSPGGTATPVPSVSGTPSAKSMTGLASPELAARNLHDAWQQGDREAGLRHASEQAVDELFRRPYYQVDYAGCDAEGTGFACFYSTEGEGIRMVVAGNREDGYRIIEVTFISS